VVTIPRAEIERYFRKVYDEIAPRADLPGFRAGKIPRKLLENRFRQTATDQVKSSLVMDSLQQVTESGEFSAISEPDMDYGAVNIPIPVISPTNSKSKFVQNSRLQPGKVGD
jgi:trigger factor